MSNPQYALGFARGFYTAGDEILKWLNSLDSEGLTLSEFRKCLAIKVLELKPNGR